MRKCYLAGPMRSKPSYNYPAFMDGATRLREAGWEVFNPAEMDIEADQVDYGAQNLTPEQQEQAMAGASMRKFARRDLDVLVNKLKTENGDAIVLLPDWEESTGAKAELAVAEWVNLAVFTLEDALTGEVR